MEKNFYDFNDKSISHTPVPRARQWEQMPIPFDSEHKQKSKYDNNKGYHKEPTKKRTLTPQELIDLFWDKLVPLGWKDDEQTYVLTCPDCDPILETVLKLEVILGKLSVSNPYLVTTKLKEHNPRCLAKREKEESDG
jgi:hypothetical protein